MEARVAFPARNRLGEGPVWSIDEQALYWIDILQPSIQKWLPGKKDAQTWQLPEHIGSFSFRQERGAILALRSGFAFYDFQTRHLVALSDPEADLNDTRLNDGKCDRSGRFFAGSMDYRESHPIGALYCYEAGGRIRKMRSKVTISNGLGWSPDNKTMYYTDSVARCIYAYDYDIVTGNMDNERVLIRDEVGFPDGLTVDSEGFIWSAKWGGWRVVRHAPDGSTDRIVKVNAAHVTSCAFGGPDLTQLYITTAWKGLSEEEKAAQPEAGHLFVVDTGIKGLPEPRFAG